VTRVACVCAGSIFELAFLPVLCRGDSAEMAAAASRTAAMVIKVFVKRNLLAKGER
jgi:hypothetical protein